jgi:hypothetical protein
MYLCAWFLCMCFSHWSFNSEIILQFSDHTVESLGWMVKTPVFVNFPIFKFLVYVWRDLLLWTVWLLPLWSLWHCSCMQYLCAQMLHLLHWLGFVSFVPSCCWSADTGLFLVLTRHENLTSSNSLPWPVIPSSFGHQLPPLSLELKCTFQSLLLLLLCFIYNFYVLKFRRISTLSESITETQSILSSACLSSTYCRRKKSVPASMIVSFLLL